MLVAYLLFIGSKIQFSESKSQRTSRISLVLVSCLSVQRYNFLKANHNLRHTVLYSYWLFIGSKIQFSESKSQRCYSGINHCSCCLSVQRYNFLKANHNIFSLLFSYFKVVYRFKDTIFWKQITTLCPGLKFPESLFIGSKIQFSESKSQRCGCSVVYKQCCLSVQRYNFLRANHNALFKFPNKSNVVYRFKDTIFWKQITTRYVKNEYIILLFIGSKIQFSESKSQLALTCILQLRSCLSVQRYNFLKANHNSAWTWTHRMLVVYRFKDTIFWKQITTI